jgi:methionyl-tRNA formyltransferase
MNVDNTPASPEQGLRIILFTNLAPVYQLAAGWAARHGHTLRLVVTTPGPPARRSTAYRGLVAAVPPEQDVLITLHRRWLGRYLASLAPDLIVSGSFPHRIPPDVTALPRLGAFNLHPAPLPRYRGPNAMRALYAGEPTLGATLHRTEAEFDAGAILYRKEVPMPSDATPENVFAALGAVAGEVWEVGLARAIAGEKGEPQDESEATYAAPFSDDEKWLDWDQPQAELQRRATALNLFGPEAKSQVEGRPVLIERLDPLGADRPDRPVGTVLEREGEALMIVVADGLVRVRATPLPETGDILR